MAHEKMLIVANYQGNVNQTHDDILLHTYLSDCHQKGHIMC